MISITTPLWQWGEGKGSARQTVRPVRWYFLTIPAADAVELRLEAMGAPRRGFGSIRVVARIGAVEWRSSIFPQKSGDYILPVKAEVRRHAAIGAGDEVELLLVLG